MSPDSVNAVHFLILLFYSMKFTSIFLFVLCFTPAVMGQILSSQYQQQNAFSRSNLSSQLDITSDFSPVQKINSGETPPGFQAVQIFRPEQNNGLNNAQSTQKQKKLTAIKSTEPNQTPLTESILLPHNSEILVSSLPKIFEK